MTSIVSAVFGGYDEPKPLPPGHGFDRAVLVTDRAAFVPGWRVVVVPREGHPRMAAKRPKMLPWEVVDDDRTLWLDGSFEVLPGLRDVVDEHLADSDMVAWRHPHRADAFEEARFSAAYPKYAAVADDLARQSQAYAAAGLPVGLWEVGMLARRHTDTVRWHGRAWLAEVDRWTVQDQVSFPYACWRTGLRPAEWRAPSHWECGWVRWHAHRDDS